MGNMIPEFFGAKVVSSAEMQRIERMAVQQGCNEDAFIAEAGKQVAYAVMREIARAQGVKRVALLVGKGNNGSDAYAAGIVLAEEGFEVCAYALFPEAQCSDENRIWKKRFQSKGRVVALEEASGLHLHEASCIVDGIFGVGFKGTADGLSAQVIRQANAAQRPIVAIDVPSALEGTTGMVRSVAVKAAQTVALGCAKTGCFLRDGWDHTGQLSVADFGLPASFVSLAAQDAYILDETKLRLPPMRRNRHKYQAGYVVGLAGSPLMQGAPKMAALAALKIGAGIVRVFHEGDIGNVPMELICQKYSKHAWEKELHRAQAVFAGPGLGKVSLRLFQNISLPIVLDADALQKNMVFPKNAILTPHRGEMLRLLGVQMYAHEEELLAECKKFAERHRVVLVLKGAPTFIFYHGQSPLLIPRGDPGMATAGSGDLLTGMIAGLLAQGLSCDAAAATAVYLHAVAGEKAAQEKTSYGMIARDILEYIPDALRTVLT